MRLTTGQPDILQWLGKIRNKQANAQFGNIAAVAAQNGHVQLFNPVGSGHQTIVRRVWAEELNADTYILAFYNTALATLAGSGVNLIDGAGGSTTQVRTTTNAGFLGTIFRELMALGNTSLVLGDGWVCELAPGQGLNVVASTVNIGLTASFEWVDV